MVDWIRDVGRAERLTGAYPAGSAHDKRPAVRHPVVLDGRPRSRPFAAFELIALQALVGNAAVGRLIAVQRDGLDDAWTTGGSPPASEGAGWSTGGPAPGGPGPIEEPGYGPPGGEPEEPETERDVVLARWILYAGTATPVAGQWFVNASRPRSGPGITPGSTSKVSLRGRPGDYGLPATKPYTAIGGYRATVAVWSSAGAKDFSNPSSTLIRITIEEPLAPGAGGGAGGGAAGGSGSEPPVSGPPTLGPKGQFLLRGSVGQAVVDLQIQLGIDADGIFGPGTERAVRQFQASQGLDVDGIVGPKTHAALDAIVVVPATGGA
jgi:hypothetical protein